MTSTSQATDSEYPVAADDVREYRQWLVKADQQAATDFEKAIMTLSGGALGISIAFLKDIVPTPQPETKIFIIIAWGTFAVSLGAILLSYLMSMRAIRVAIKRVDDGVIYKKGENSCASALTWICNILGALGFFLGVIFFLLFATANFA